MLIMNLFPPNVQISNSDMSTFKSEAPKRKREVSVAEREERDARRQARADEEKAIAAQHQELKESKLAQAEAR